MSNPPFTIRIFAQDSPDPHMIRKEEVVNRYLPATSRVQDDIVVPRPEPEFLKRELSVKRLDDMQKWLWMCGRPMPPRPLHHQRLLARQIIISENAELHLVWWRNRIFIKPLPCYLLDPDFWTTHINTGSLAACARGFLFSYSALVAYKSDFLLAKEYGLLPEEVTWEAWKVLTAQFLDGHRYDCVTPRYWYGELRLSRLNVIYRLFMGYPLRGYSRVASHTLYGDLLYDNFSALAGTLFYVVVALSAMQVGQGIDELWGNETFRSTTYGFTIFAMIAPLVGFVLIFVFIVIMFASNWAATKAYEKERFKQMRVELI